MVSPPCFCRALTCLVALSCSDFARAEIQYVIAISVDGLRGDYLKTFVDTAPSEFPNFVRLRDSSAFTYNARCDYDVSETVPNHLTMVTGRPVSQPVGLTQVQHGFSSNFPTTTDTVHSSGSNPDMYKTSIFDVVHDRGLSTALYLGKTRLAIVERSYNVTHGALDAVGPDNGRDKIDFSRVQDGNTGTLISTLVGHLGAGVERFTFLHITDPDTAGHASGWSTTNPSPYRTSIKTIDGYLGSILDGLAANPVYAGVVAVLLTGDHGGGGNAGTPNGHTDATQAGNYTVPFFVSAPGIAPGSDLYSLLENRFDPAGSRPTYAAAAQPIWNGDIAILSTALLGLPAIPGAFLMPELRKPVTVARDGNNVVVRWPQYLTGWTLESTDDLRSETWQPITTGISDLAGERVHTAPVTPPENRFFRLRRPADAAQAARPAPASMQPAGKRSARQRRHAR